MYYYVKFDTQGRGNVPAAQRVYIMYPSTTLLPMVDVYPGMMPYARRPNDPYCDEYKFSGWYTDLTFEHEWDFEHEVVTHNMTLYAKWVRVAVYWNGNRHDEQFIYRRVAWGTWQEHEEYDWITKGSIEQSADTELKVTGSFDFEGYVLPNESDLIRVYYQFTDDYNTRASTAIATLLVSYADLDYYDTLKGVKSSGTLDGQSVLSILDDKKIGVPETIRRNSNAVYEAEQLAIECGLQTNTEPSSFALSADHTFDAGTSYLEMVNWLLTTAGYTEAFPDPYGVVQMLSYATAQQRTDYAIFANNDESIMYPEIVETNNWQQTPNVVRLIYNTDDACVAAWARNETGSRASLDARAGREITYFEEISDLGEGVSKANSLRELAEKTLLEESSDIEYVTFEHAYKPLVVFDPVKVNYADMEWTGNVDNISVDLSPATKTQTKVKRIMSAEIEMTSGAQSYRGV